MCEETELPVDLIERFESLQVNADQFDHREHVHLAWTYLEVLPWTETILRLPAALARFAEHHGAANRYHATITWAFLLLVNERRERLGAHSWSEFVNANPDLLTYRPNVLERYYHPQTLGSDLARKVFMLPDRGLVENAP